MSWREHSWKYAILLGLTFSPALYGGCGEDDAASGADSKGGRPTSGAGNRPEDDGDGETSPRRDGGAASGSKPALPAEKELALNFQTPRAGRSSVYVPNPTTNRVAVVNAANNFAIESVSVGTQPTFASTVPGEDVAIVLNVGSRDAALLRTKDGRTSVKQLPVGHDANAIAVSPNKQHAVIYLNANATGAAAQSFQDVTVVTLAEGSEKAQRVSVGFRPRGVLFSGDGQQAFVITEHGISIVQLAALDAAAPTIARLVGLGDSLRDPQSVDVQVTSDGAFALARRDGDSTLRLINLADGVVQTLSLAQLGPRPAPPSAIDAGLPVPDAGPLADAGTVDAGGEAVYAELTDLDLAPDGTFALAVLRDRGLLVRIPIPLGFRDPSAITVKRVEDQLIGSVTIAEAGTLAVAYTTAAPIESVVLIDLIGDAPPRGVRLRKAVRAVAVSSDGRRALVLHSAVGTLTATSSEEARIDASEGYSVINTEANSGFAKLQLTPSIVKPSDIVLTPDGTRVFALLRDDAKQVRAVDVVDLGSFQIDSISLTKPPTSIGFLPIEPARVFIGQSSEGGMLTFLDVKSGAKVSEVSGFEIASRIRQ